MGLTNIFECYDIQEMEENKIYMTSESEVLGLEDVCKIGFSSPVDQRNTLSLRTQKNS